MPSLVLLLALVYQTSDPAIAVKPNTPFLIEWPQPNATPDLLFRWVCNNEIRKNFSTSEPIAQGPATPEGTIVYRVQVPGLPQGKYQCHIRAFNDFGEARGEDTELPVGVAPSQPGSWRIIQIIVGGW